jgi:hypothetical protein
VVKTLVLPMLSGFTEKMSREMRWGVPIPGTVVPIGVRFKPKT